MNANQVREMEWLTAARQAIDNYIHQPCEAFGLNMLRAVTSRTLEEMRSDAGIVLAVAEECRDSGYTFVSPAYWWIFWLLLKLGQWLTRKHATWNEYWILKWSFRRELKCAVRLHARCHSLTGRLASAKAERAIEGLISADREFHFVMRKHLADVGCSRCWNRFFEIP